MEHQTAELLLAQLRDLTEIVAGHIQDLAQLRAKEALTFACLQKTAHLFSILFDGGTHDETGSTAAAAARAEIAKLEELFRLGYEGKQQD
jgi:hypothetical protein